MSTGSDKYRGTKEYLLVYCELIQAARYRGLTTYQRVAQIVGLPLSGNYMGSELGDVLGAISEDEIGLGRPMLSALAVGVSGVPGEGFYTWARKLGRLEETSREAERRFWEEEKEAVYEAWKREFKIDDRQ